MNLPREHEKEPVSNDVPADHPADEVEESVAPRPAEAVPPVDPEGGPEPGPGIGSERGPEGGSADGDSPGAALEGEDDGDEAAILRERVEELEAHNRELSDRYVRLVAEFDNYRRRTRQNEAVIRATAAEALLVDLLPVLDNLQLAIDAAGDALQTPFGQGVSLISHQLGDVLGRHGLTPIVTQGQPFDPNTMEAVARAEPEGDVPDGHVVEEYRRGYKLHDKLLRASQVKVAQAQQRDA